MRAVRLGRSWDHASLEDASEALLAGPVEDFLRDHHAGQHRYALEATLAFRLLGFQEAIEAGCQKEVGVRVPHEFPIVALGHPDADRKQRLSDCVLHRDVDAQHSDAALLVCLCSTEELPNPPAPVATEIEVTQESIYVRPASGVELQGVVLEFVTTEEHGEEL